MALQVSSNVAPAAWLAGAPQVEAQLAGGLPDPGIQARQSGLDAVDGRGRSLVLTRSSSMADTDRFNDGMILAREPGAPPPQGGTVEEVLARLQASGVKVVRATDATVSVKKAADAK